MSVFLPHLVQGNDFATQHRTRISKFLVAFNDSNNSRVVYIGQRAKCYAHGALGRNHIRCRGNTGIDPVSTDLRARAHTIRELMDVRDGIMALPGVCRNEIESAIDFLCCY